MVVIGSGPGGQRAAVQAAKLHRRVALIDRAAELGGVSVNTGTIPSKTLRQAIIHVTGMRSVADLGTRGVGSLAFDAVLREMARVMQAERAVVRDQLQRNGVRVFEGVGRFAGPGELVVTQGADEMRLRADHIIIATGSRPSRPDGIAFNERTILDSDGIVQMTAVPRAMVVVGGGVIGVEYASMFAALGCRVTLVNHGTDILDFCDREIVGDLVAALRYLGVTLRLGERVVAVEEHAAGTVTRLESGKRIAADVVLYSAGRRGATDGLGLEAIGVEPDKRGLIPVGPTYETAAPGVWAVGDVIGFPALAATSAEQGRIAACHALGRSVEAAPALLPYGIYAIPEISFVGKTEQALTAAGVPYEVGVARFRELARGQISGAVHGLLKLLVGADRGLLGVHIIGGGATELVHIGQAVMALGGGVDYLVDAVFNYPTLAEAYKVAALNASNQLSALEEVERS